MEITKVICVVGVQEVVPEPSNVSDCIKAFLNDPQWLKHIKDPQMTNQEANFFK